MLTIYIDGEAVVENVTQNGTCYVPEEKVDESVFPKLFTLTVKDEDDNVVDEREHAYLDRQTEHDGGWLIIFNNIPQDVWAQMEMQDKIDYIAMMADIDIDE
jgi:hypothetical protein